ncbi:hypothetical protein GLOIN_2v1780438 [Rhizophagus irregularis DAOM 181602=DAOM 197198]|uniref:Uncharacterized protein n=1 Tax=Rhizophagus irregularis (strain DAOM 181602 / DAOM 197198 / MUCL 43194) TaxID=747089 RepID=A0A2P4PMA2_RHIID|nr:hypothetical protein GLOIN_2v1780438 [Rhizophagus irregularis DAOM 181602=DAOM 197198]POG66505.1 hypothetical protein GLOIN_2v1780438 [Rhizophagus irregularis DAOM 181602=DAOM 197198]GBC15754.2 hypothetical protein GLOIN_2v1780438 [Rhizophagus irregularis DAOM 181602=DAOM 197198]|eukprot:XP_025173371.1 hypothetical protein GLOIN_2v1780438 [Rhizophagus irregularis DAOM 181602=DAOM 197198]
MPKLLIIYSTLKHRNIEFLKANRKYNERCDANKKELKQKNAGLKVRLAVVEKSSVVVDGQLQNDKKAILEILPEVSADNDSIVDQFKQYVPICKVNDMVSEVLPEVNTKLSAKRKMDKSLNKAYKKSVKIIVDLKLSLSTGNDISVSLSIEKVDTKATYYVT